MVYNNDKKRQIMRVVEELAARKSLYEITLDEVAKAARIGKGTIYHYFKDKEDLFFEVATSGFDELCEVLGQEIPNDAPFAVKFSEVCGRVMEFFAGRQQLLQIMQAQACCTYWSGERFRERWLDKRRNLVGVISHILSEGAAEGAIRSDLSTDFLAVSLLGILRNYSRDSAAGFDFKLKCELLEDLFLNGACQLNGRKAVHYSETFEGGE